MSKVGRIISLDKGRFLWIIDNFLSHAWYDNIGLESPNFNFSDSLCNLFLKFVKSGFLQLHFIVQNHEPSHKFHVRLGMPTGLRGKIETRSGEVSFFGGFGESVWMQCSEIMERRCEILPNGRLTVSCKLRRLDMEDCSSVLSKEHPSPFEEKVVVENETSESDSDEYEEEIIDCKAIRKLQKDLKSLLMTGEDSDVTIKVMGKEFPVHRFILRARSPVFRSMFSHEMVEKQSGVVVIDDCDPVTFPDFLQYVYTGSTRHICDENVYQLYTASDKYGIDELKGECAKFMKNNLSVDRFCDAITLAIRHNENELVVLATVFFCENTREITKTAQWQVFLCENTTVGNELFLRALSSKKDN